MSFAQIHTEFTWKLNPSKFDAQSSVAALRHTRVSSWCCIPQLYPHSISFYPRVIICNYTINVFFSIYNINIYVCPYMSHEQCSKALQGLMMKKGVILSNTLWIITIHDGNDRGFKKHCPIAGWVCKLNNIIQYPWKIGNCDDSQMFPWYTLW